jgi:hypothetical protein
MARKTPGIDTRHAQTCPAARDHDAAMLRFAQWWRREVRNGYGSFDVASEPGKGTTIVVRFPIALLQRDQAAEGSSPNGSAGHVVPGAIGGSPRTSDAGPRSEAGRPR